MPQIPGTTTATEAPAASTPAATKAKSNGKPKAAKKTATKKKTPAKKKATGAPRAKKDGLRKPQIRILKTLSKNSKPLTRSEIADKAPVDVATCVEYLGSDDDSVRKANDKKHFPSLVTLGFVKATDGSPKKGKDGTFSDNAGPTEYSITATGRKALEAAGKE